MVTTKISGREAAQGHCSDRRKPDLFIVGAPKCGTTAMAQYLAAHPDVYMAKKEMNVFGADLRFGPQFYRRDLPAYLTEFDSRNGQSRAGEASVWYLFSTHAAAELRAFNPESRIIIMLREPAEMLYSLYYQFRFDGNEHLPSFAEALAAEDERRAGRRLSRQTYFAQGLLYRETARYTEQVRRYFDVFGRDRVHVVIYDDFAADVGAAYRATLDFLGLDYARIPSDFHVINGNKSVKHPALRAVLGDPLVRSTALAIARKLPRPVFTALHNVERRLWKLNSRPEKRPPLAPELRAALQREFSPEVERLSALLGRGLTPWNSSKPVGCGAPAPAPRAALPRSDRTVACSARAA